MPFDSYLLKYPEVDCKEEIISEMGQACRTNEVQEDGDDNHDVPDSGWTSPVDVGCCCVCHENGDADCEWCTDCKYI